MAVRNFRHKSPHEPFVNGRSAKIGSQYRNQALLILDRPAAATELADLEGVRKFHALRGDRAGRYAMWVSGNYRITFGWEAGHAVDVDFEDYH